MSYDPLPIVSLLALGSSDIRESTPLLSNALLSNWTAEKTPPVQGSSEWMRWSTPGELPITLS